jgi:hypothetical protein
MFNFYMHVQHTDISSFRRWQTSLFHQIPKFIHTVEMTHPIKSIQVLESQQKKQKRKRNVEYRYCTFFSLRRLSSILLTLLSTSLTCIRYVLREQSDQLTNFIYIRNNPKQICLHRRARKLKNRRWKNSQEDYFLLNFVLCNSTSTAPYLFKICTKSTLYFMFFSVNT